MPTRRETLKTIIATSAAAALPASRAMAAEELTENDPIALALGYKRDANAVDTQQYPKRAGAEGAKQFCDNCALYGSTSEQLGTCTAIPNKLVAAKGWCNAWIPNP